jgi:hypothetical protein
MCYTHRSEEAKAPLRRNSERLVGKPDVISGPQLVVRMSIIAHDANPTNGLFCATEVDFRTVPDRQKIKQLTIRFPENQRKNVVIKQ